MLSAEESELAYIMNSLVPEWQKQFTKAHHDYGEDPDSLGPSAIFVDVWRKARKLRRALWDKQTPNFDTPRQVCIDLIGHCFLIIAQLDKEEHDGNETN